jgi:hypothetical protein
MFRKVGRLAATLLGSSALVASLEAQAGALSITNISLIGRAPKLTIQSDLGLMNQIQYKTSLDQSNWVVLTNLPVVRSPYIFVDTNNHPSACFYSVATSGPAPAYFVDSAQGNDSSDGLSPASAFQSVLRLEQADATNHQSIWNFARGSVWREQCTVYSNNMLLQAYGVGPRPLFDASGVMTNSNFTKTPGWTNTWQILVGVSNMVLSPQWINVWENGITVPRATSITNCDLTPGSYWVENDNAYPNLVATIWIDPVKSADPTVDGNLYEYTQRQNGIFSGSGTNVSVVGLATRRNLDNDGSLKVVDYSIVNDCAANDGGKHNLFIGGNSCALNCVATNAYYPAGCAMFIGNNATTGDVTFSNCYAISTVPYGSSWYQMGGFYAHTAGTPGEQFGLVSEINCSSFGLGNSFGAWATNMIIEGCVGDGVLGLASTNIFVCDTSINTSNNQAVNSSGNCLTLAVSNCSFICSALHGEALFMPGVVSFSSTNSVYSATNQGWGLLEQSSSIVTNWQTYSNSVAAYWNYYKLTENPTSFLSDSNAFASPNGAGCQMSIGRTNYDAMAAYAAAMAADTNSSYP